MTDLNRHCFLPILIKMTEDDLQCVLESIERLKEAGAMEADELAHIERSTREWIEFFQEKLKKGRG
ncbi:MAG: hypothetical protein ACXWCY_22215 [Burkholderiales bacterium]